MGSIYKAIFVVLAYLILGELLKWAFGWEANWQTAMNAVAFYALIRTFDEPAAKAS